MDLGHLTGTVNAGGNAYQKMQQYLANPRIKLVSITDIVAWEDSEHFEKRLDHYQVHAQVLKIKRKKTPKEVSMMSSKGTIMRSIKLDQNSRTVLFQ